MEMCAKRLAPAEKLKCACRCIIIHHQQRRRAAKREGLQKKNWLRVANWAVIPYWWRGPNNRYADDAAKFRIRKLAWKYYLRLRGARVCERRHQKATQITQIAIRPEAKRATSRICRRAAPIHRRRAPNDAFFPTARHLMRCRADIMRQYTHNRPPFDFANWKLRPLEIKLSIILNWF